MILPGGYKCQECGRKFKTAKSAEWAFHNGCPKCNGCDIDIDPDAGVVVAKTSVAKKVTVTKTVVVEKPAPTRAVEVKAEDGEAVTIRIPVGSMDRPTAESEKIMKAHEDPRGWKYPIRPYMTLSQSEAEDYAYCLNWYCGGHESRTEERTIKLDSGTKLVGTVYIVSSKGYYHYVCA